MQIMKALSTVTKNLKTKITISLLIFAVSFNTLATTQSSVGMGAVTLGSMGVFMGLATGVAVAMTGGVALGALGVAVLITESQSSSPTTSNNSIEINLDPNKPLKTPDGWTPPVPPSIQPTPPNSIPSNITYSNGSTGGFSSQQLAAESFVADMDANNGARYVTSLISVVPDGNKFTINFTTTDINNGSSGTGSQNGSYTATCSSGYIPATYDVNNKIATCSAVTPELVPKPITGTDAIVRTGDTFSRDPKQNPADNSPQVIVTPSTVVVVSNDGSVTTVNINPDGTTSVTTKKPNPYDSNTTETKTDLSAPDAQGKVSVIGITSAQTTGQGTANTGTGAGQLDISGLNKETTQKSIDTTLKDIKKAVECKPPDCEIPASTMMADKQAIADEIKKTTDMVSDSVNESDTFETSLGWSTWFPNFPTGACTPYQLHVLTSTVNWDFCPYIQKLNELLGWLFALFGAWTITSKLFEKD